ncbi:hypothetical protein BKA69DRAFT_1170601 [Paraphysoderma sedebokerense]|nr:hypothetical protein BKA69DRAFT_1170597 [Paraphysoderma sedebokerense]KAI9136580.1 hypothetical protein BKA69DRAFT_1170601 [Paraphysoderma sedebokerense]
MPSIPETSSADPHTSNARFPSELGAILAVVCLYTDYLSQPIKNSSRAAVFTKYGCCRKNEKKSKQKRKDDRIVLYTAKIVKAAKIPDDDRHSVPQLPNAGVPVLPIKPKSTNSLASASTDYMTNEPKSAAKKTVTFVEPNVPMTLEVTPVKLNTVVSVVNSVEATTEEKATTSAVIETPKDDESKRNKRNTNEWGSIENLLTNVKEIAYGNNTANSNMASDNQKNTDSADREKPEDRFDKERKASNKPIDFLSLITGVSNVTTKTDAGNNRDDQMIADESHTTSADDIPYETVTAPKIQTIATATQTEEKDLTSTFTQTDDFQYRTMDSSKSESIRNSVTASHISTNDLVSSYKDYSLHSNVTSPVMPDTSVSPPSSPSPNDTYYYSGPPLMPLPPLPTPTPTPTTVRSQPSMIPLPPPIPEQGLLSLSAVQLLSSSQTMLPKVSKPPAPTPPMMPIPFPPPISNSDLRSLSAVELLSSSQTMLPKVGKPPAPTPPTMPIPLPPPIPNPGLLSLSAVQLLSSSQTMLPKVSKPPAPAPPMMPKSYSANVFTDLKEVTHPLEKNDTNPLKKASIINRYLALQKTLNGVNDRDISDQTASSAPSFTHQRSFTIQPNTKSREAPGATYFFSDESRARSFSADDLEYAKNNLKRVSPPKQGPNTYPHPIQNALLNRLFAIRKAKKSDEDTPNDNEGDW